MRAPSSAALVALVLGLTAPAASQAAAASAADFGAEPASTDVRRIAAWAAAGGDSQGLGFVIVDKADAKVFVFGPDGRLRGAAPALLGAARGDDSVPGIGQHKLADIRPDERTTSAGRFVSGLGGDLGQKDVVWVDYGAAISLHRVITTNPREHRVQRLATTTIADNRISYGCINVQADFFDRVVRPIFSGASGIVYILPEVRAIDAVFAIHEAGGSHGAPCRLGADIAAVR